MLTFPDHLYLHEGHSQCNEQSQNSCQMQKCEESLQSAFLQNEDFKTMVNRVVRYTHV